MHRFGAAKKEDVEVGTRCFHHPISIPTAMALAEDAERSGDQAAAAQWFALAEELEREVIAEKARRKAAERDQLLQHVRRWGMR